MDTTNIAILILTVLDAGIIVLAFQFDRMMYKRSVFLQLTIANSTLFLNTEFDEPINRVLLSRGGKLIMIICYLTAILIELVGNDRNTLYNLFSLIILPVKEKNKQKDISTMPMNKSLR